MQPVTCVIPTQLTFIFVTLYGFSRITHTVFTTMVWYRTVAPPCPILLSATTGLRTRRPIFPSSPLSINGFFKKEKKNLEFNGRDNVEKFSISLN